MKYESGFSGDVGEPTITGTCTAFDDVRFLLLWQTTTLSAVSGVQGKVQGRARCGGEGGVQP